MASTYKRGFTLIELLVVVAIIGILAAILFPVFARAREQARKASCSSNLKQIGLSFQMYSQDYDEKFPANYNVDLGRQGWAERVQPYIKSLQVFQCPSEAQSQLLPQRYTDYFLSVYLAIPTQGVSESEISFPSSTISHGESRYGKADLYCAGSMSTGPAGIGCESGSSSGDDNIQPPAVAANIRRHSEGANYLFVDGHVKWLRPEVPIIFDYANTQFVTPGTFGFRFRP